MADDVGDIAHYYNSDPQREHRRLEEHQLEYDLTWRYLDQYLPAHGRILEVGAATGRYTVPLAKRGYHVTAVDMSAALLDECRKRIVAEGLERQIDVVEADAGDLTPVTEKDFDAVLLMGPLYHLVNEADRVAAVQAARDRLRPGGIIVAAFISRFGALSDVIKNIPAWIEDQGHVRSFIERGQRPDGAPRGGFRGYFARAAELAPLHEALGFDTIVVAGVEAVIGADDASYNKLGGTQRQLWLDVLYAVSAEPSILGASRHLLYIGRKQ